MIPFIRPAAAIVLFSAFHAASAQDYPNKPIRVVVTSPVGSTPEEFDAKFKADLAKVVRIVKEARIPMQD